MLKNTMVTAIAVLIAALMAFPKQARGDGFYIGAGAGGATLEGDSGDVSLPALPGSIDEDDTAVKVFGGYNWKLPVLTLGAEAAYSDFGDAEVDTAFGQVGIDTSGLSFWGVASVDIGPVELFGKAGVLAWDVESRFLQQSTSADGTNAAYGAGLRFLLGSVEVRGEYELYDLDGADLSMLSLGVAYRF